MQPWTLVLSEYLDLAYLLRRSGIPALTARNAEEALTYLQNWLPQRLVLDPAVAEWQRVAEAVSGRGVQIEMVGPVLRDLLQESA